MNFDSSCLILPHVVLIFTPVLARLSPLVRALGGSLPVSDCHMCSWYYRRVTGSRDYWPGSDTARLCSIHYSVCNVLAVTIGSLSTSSCFDSDQFYSLCLHQSKVSYSFLVCVRSAHQIVIIFLPLSLPPPPVPCQLFQTSPLIKWSFPFVLCMWLEYEIRSDKVIRIKWRIFVFKHTIDVTCKRTRKIKHEMYRWSNIN